MTSLAYIKTSITVSPPNNSLLGWVELELPASWDCKVSFTVDRVASTTDFDQSDGSISETHQSEAVLSCAAATTVTLLL